MDRRIDKDLDRGKIIASLAEVISMHVTVMPYFAMLNKVVLLDLDLNPHIHIIHKNLIDCYLSQVPATNNITEIHQ